jgi:uncharacterized protein (DUF1499 family)
MSTGTITPHRPPASKAALAGFWLGLIALIVLGIAGPGYRMHWWNLQTGLQRLIPVALILGLLAILLSLAGLFISYRKGLAFVGLILGIVAAGIPAKGIYVAKHSPIHDVSTDTSNPPQFSAVLPLREQTHARNSTNYEAKTAELQRQTYPDIGPLHLDIPPAQAFDRALNAARGMRWDIVSTDSAQGRLEATATTFWFGFKDDVVVRITPDGNGSRVDVRSESRIGGSDVGANAKRIREYLSKVKNG